MKRKVHLAIPWLMALILLIISVNSKAAQIHYFNFNENVPGQNISWAQPIDATIGSGQLTYTFTQAYSFGGTTINGNLNEVNGGSFVPRGGVESINNGEHFILSVPTVGYESIVLTYASQRTATGFSTQTVHFTINGTDWIQIAEFTEIPTAFALFTVNFSSVTGANNNPNFAVKFVLTGATAEAGNNRFDNISVNGTRIPFDTLWQFSTATANLPAWFGANRGMASFGNNLLIAKQSPVTIHVLNRLTGLETGTLNTTGIAGGFWALNDIEVSDDGVIFAANGVITNANGNFKVYQVSTDPEVVPMLVIDYDVSGYPAVRLGDKFTVVGSVADGTAAIYAADGSENRIFKWTIDDTKSFGAPEIITLPGRGGSNVVAPLPNGNFYYTGTGINVQKFSADGTLLGTIPGGILPTGTTGMKYLGMEGNDEILAVYHYGAADGYLRVVRVPNGIPANASLIFRTPVLGPANSAGNGDVAFVPNADGMNVDLYVLDTSDGIGGYKSNTLNLVFPDYADPGDPVFAVTPTSRNFGTVLLGETSAVQTFTITNTGAGTITINPADIVLTGADVADFVFTNITEAAVLDLNETATFTVAFAPLTEGAKTAAIQINDNMGEKVLHEIALSGTGVDPTLHPPFTQDFNTTPFPPEYWTRFSGLLQEQTTLTSTTSGWVHGQFGYIGTVNNAARLNVYGTGVNRWLVTPPIDLGDGTTDYELVFDVSLNKWNTANPPDMNGTDDKFAIVISTDGGLTWSAANTLRLYDNAGSPFVYNNISHTGETVVINLSDYSGVVKIAFYGESTLSNADNDIYVDNVTVQEIPENPVFAITPTSWNFGDVEVGFASVARVFTVSNTGPGILTVNAPVLDNNDDFILSYTAEDFPAELSGSETVTFSVVFEPEAVGEALGEISIGYDDGTANTATVELTGNGIVRPAGSTCGNPYVIASLPLVDFSGNTDVMGDDYSSTWITPNSNYLNGNDMVFQFTLEEPGFLSASMTSPNTWIGLFILEDCPDPDNPPAVIRTATSSGSAVSFANQYMEAGTYFAIVSSYPAPQTIAFTLNLSFDPGYTVTFVVEDEENAPITDAIITLGSVTNPAGDYVFDNKLPGTYAYTVVKEGYFNATGEVIVVDADVLETVTMQLLPTIPVLVSITPVPNVSVEYGTLEADAIAALAPTTTITDSNSDIYTVGLTWTIASYNGDVAGAYTATGTFTLPEGVEQPEPPIALAVTATVTVLEPPVVINTFPWLETFEQADFPPNGWARHNVDGGGTQWVLSTAQNHTPGGTRSAFHNYAAASAGNQNGWMVTPLLQLPNEDMRLIFWSYNSFPTFYGNNSVLVSTGSSDPASDDFVQVWTTATVAGSWVETIVDLSEFAGEEIYIAFRYQGLDAHGWYLDDVLVEVAPEFYTVTFHVAEDVTDGAAIEGALIAITGFPSITTDAAGMASIELVDGNYTASVTKVGYEPESVTFTVDGQDIDVTVAMMDVIVNPFNLNVTTEDLEPGQAHLSWNESLIVLEDDFESYPSFTLDLSPWTVYEETGFGTYTIENTTFPNQAQPFGYIIFDPSGTTPPLTSTGYQAYSGTKYAAHMAQTTGPDNSWLVTPQLSIADGMEFRFMAKSIVATYGLERFNVYVSTTGNAIADFVKISEGTYIQAPTTWTQYSYDLSAYSGEDVYLAIQCVSNDAFLFMVDDVFVGIESKDMGKAFVAYNVFLDDMTTPVATVTDTDYLFNGLAAGEYTAGVQAVYTTGLSDIVTIDFEIEGDPTFSVTFVIEDEDGDPIADAVVTLDGETNAAGNYIFENIMPGTYAYTVVKEGYLNATGQVVVVDANLTVPVVMVAEIETFAVTFNVNMTYVEGFDPASDVVYVAGVMNWSAPGDDPDNQLMTRVDDSMIWTKTLQLAAGTYEYKYFLNAGWDGGEWPGVDNRDLTVEDDMVVNDWFGSLTDPTSITDPSLAQIRVFPVPARTILFITSPEVIRDLRIIDMLGQVAYSANVAGLSHEVNVGGFKDGIYFIQILTAKGIETRRIQVQK